MIFWTASFCNNLSVFILADDFLKSVHTELVTRVENNITEFCKYKQYGTCSHWCVYNTFSEMI